MMDMDGDKRAGGKTQGGGQQGQQQQTQREYIDYDDPMQFDREGQRITGQSSHYFHH